MCGPLCLHSRGDPQSCLLLQQSLLQFRDNVLQASSTHLKKVIQVLNKVWQPVTVLCPKECNPLDDHSWISPRGRALGMGWIHHPDALLVLLLTPGGLLKFSGPYRMTIPADFAFWLSTGQSTLANLHGLWCSWVPAMLSLLLWVSTALQAGMVPVLALQVSKRLLAHISGMQGWNFHAIKPLLPKVIPKLPDPLPDIAFLLHELIDLHLPVWQTCSATWHVPHPRDCPHDEDCAEWGPGHTVLPYSTAFCPK